MKIERLVNASIYELFVLVAEGRNIVYLKFCSGTSQKRKAADFVQLTAHFFRMPYFQA